MTSLTSLKVIVGLSGGVDSSVAALLLIEQGFEVEALFMKNWEEDDTDGHCTAQQDLSDAQKVANKLGIKLHTVNFSSDYWDDVFEHFLQEHKKGRTPNPDVLCNQKIKFKAFLDYALNLGADKISTGHYARITQENDLFQLKVGLDNNKDQSYFLHLLNQHQLSKSLFPLGEINKDEVRKIAAENGFITADKKDSTGICFIGERNFSEFLQTYLPTQQGDIVDENGQFIKHHQGLAFYTIGQRKGLEIGGGFGTSGAPWFVADKRLKNNELLVVQGDNPLLYHQSLSASNPHWITATPTFPLKCMAKIRYRQVPQDCTISDQDGEIQVKFDQPQRAITPGQSVVFYAQDVCLGGAIIKTRRT
ncbi:tRNA-specific 2-thiouridylase MnmA (EC 2.8.1.13) [uncultured Gammaproteobacteria bacterium]|jgi:tRNA-specific 2-thiouridylase|uniref:tRNA 2-thiouridine(34) synthase MnmA n=1 Tax=thiotrophic endosymbiont of Bathymodiolus puteoserpentis (Logatchev) TaxID=343240 RepID=UPI0010B45BF0|nr:tRNA 2-thiouridine(34) synthase MnmA [thiotrophic endosymbiont of Bathymodiolus puteoserpentis (Logatchev)]CAC9498840.1 tRNA-specific 2-thiouridylase MnmA (EC 2.8.1.13) [uncultured Gammaproteobacteria bacterium]CAC9502287.1 tRNA-specific 2-thiouridylase MnmA (EC 2.8.1.13) [uncultured Gammaproteobacteria bacterium]CAC9581559.1 tRNA-specific 2-thiouridylase MnmA (EC 2.8.1.13) [uncultured Gammaproteobacteria bacterium]CAC9642780.1 tRNA-specific 2-thiouridylase MnmA (EC 2.8.1.13) [uncultured Gam